MQDWLGIGLLYLVGILFLVAELFLPSYGVLTVFSLGLLGYALYLTFGISQTAGMVALVSLLVIVPSLIVLMVKTWYRTSMGRRISPPNPALTPQDRMPVEDLQALVGSQGRTLTMLRPVGLCMFNGRRVESSAEYGMIAANVAVEGVRLADRTLVVRPVATAAGPSGAESTEDVNATPEP
jgi:membrane-bound serine protease (ClpP class)